ncbi:COP9 signalosome complex subunit 1 [Hibiscus syriacus]|uniref:COP9 signalosome complex subunit 1 n=1 Tax=Hibiscus syriacus TaxID=106335 RepID=A0A6A3C843_HIBSY|nr:COP9 signalosome complex subunit 1 [Hibiscus syriacus]
MGYNDFGDFCYAHGALGDAFKSYVRTRDYCTTSKHIIQMCLSAILVSIKMGQFGNVTSYVCKAEQTPEALEPSTVAKLCCAAGLAHLEAKKYKLAARKFLEVGPELGDSYSENIVIDNTNFRDCWSWYLKLGSTRIIKFFMHGRHADQRNKTFQRVLQTGNEFDQDVRAMLLRANLLKHECNLNVSRKV